MVEDAARSICLRFGSTSSRPTALIAIKLREEHLINSFNNYV